ncbi:MAG: ATP-binding protein [Phycisphaerae bacterium]|nr:ATP-binding protein [Phycisphaerae bacterium]
MPDDLESLNQQLTYAKKLLMFMEEQAAGYTALTLPAHLRLQIEEQQQAIASLEARLAQATGRGRAAVPDNLPARPTIFVGRSDELRRCLDALSPDVRGWGVTIDGQGGIGKTALALEVAHAARAQAWFDAYCFASAKTAWLTAEGVRAETLALSSLDAFVRETARVLGCADVERMTEAVERRRALLDALRGRRVLLLWDNLETLCQEERDQVAEFLSRLPGDNKAILTSRRRTGEIAFTLRLDSLTKAEAADLLAKLAARQPRVAGELRRAGESGARALHEAAGGNPLVLHWAVGQMMLRGLTLPDATARIQSADRSGDLYTFLFADAASDLGASDKTILSAFTGFQTPVDAATLADVTQLTANVVATALERLVILSLVNDLPGGRYGLHPLTRAFVRAALNGAPQKPAIAPLRLDPAARRAALRYWVDYAQKYGDDKDAYQTHDRLEAEWANLDAAATELYALTGLPGALADDEAAKMLNDLANALYYFTWFRGYWDEAIRLDEWGYAAAVARQDWSNAGWRAYRAALIHYHRAATDLLDLWAARCAEAWERGGSRRERAFGSRLRGVAAEQRQDYAAAERLYAEALAAYRNLGAEADQAMVLNDLGGVAWARKDYVRAETYYREALALAEKLGNKEPQAYITGNLGQLALDRDRPAEARPLFERALALDREVGREDLFASDLYGLARVLEEEGRPREALPLAEESLRSRERLRHKDLGSTRSLVARLREKVGG